MKQASVDKMHSSGPEVPELVFEYIGNSSEIMIKIKFLAVNAKHRRITKIYPPIFAANWLAAL